MHFEIWIFFGINKISSSFLAQQPLSVKACLHPFNEVSLAFSDLL